MTVSQWQEVSEPLQAEHDDVVIGAGIVGSYAATLLHQRGRDVAWSMPAFRPPVHRAATPALC